MYFGTALQAEDKGVHQTSNHRTTRPRSWVTVDALYQKLETRSRRRETPTSHAQLLSLNDLFGVVALKLWRKTTSHRINVS